VAGPSVADMTAALMGALREAKVQSSSGEVVLCVSLNQGEPARAEVRTARQIVRGSGIVRETPTL
jgi:hypothetical protein